MNIFRHYVKQEGKIPSPPPFDGDVYYETKVVVTTDEDGNKYRSNVTVKKHKPIHPIPVELNGEAFSLENCLKENFNLKDCGEFVISTRFPEYESSNDISPLYRELSKTQTVDTSPEEPSPVEPSPVEPLCYNRLILDVQKRTSFLI